MKRNKNFAKSDDGLILQYAPSEFEYGGVFYNATNSEKIYNEMGFFRLEKTKAPVKEGFYHTAFYEEKDGCLFEKWQEHEITKEENEYEIAAKILLGEEEE